MKLDKDTLIKEHFWVLLFLSLFLVVVSLIFLLTTASSAIAEQEKKFTDQKKNLKSISDGQPKNAEWSKSYETRFVAAEAQEKKIWDHAWREQANLSTWPTNMPKEQLDLLQKHRFYDPIQEVGIRATYADASNYKQQAYDLYRIVAPTQFNAALRWINEWKLNPPTSEDMWLAQEDLWVQRGLLQIIRETNERLAALKETKAVNERQKVFSNSSWILDLTLAEAGGKPSLKYTLVNNSNRRQVLPVTFEVLFGDVPYTLEVSGEPLAPGQSFSQTVSLPVQFANARSLKSAKQLYDWRTVPVKRVDHVELAYNSSRTGQSTLQPPLRYKPPETPASDPNAAGGQGMQVGKGGGAGATDTSVTENGLNRNRYIERSEQVRRMPIAISVVIDQYHIQDFLAAVANSPLRVQTTQWQWQRFRDDIKPPETDQPTTGQPTTAPSAPIPPPAPGPKGVGKAGPPSSEMQLGPGRDEGDAAKRMQAGKPRTPQGLPVSVQPASSAATTAAAEEQEWDLVTLAVYGVASLYEKYPPPDPAATAAAGETKTP